MPGGGCAPDPAYKTEAAGPASAAPPGQNGQRLQNTPLLAGARLAGETFLYASQGSGQSQTFSSPSEEIPPQLP